MADPSGFAPCDWWQVTLESTADAVLVADTGCRVTFMNPAAERLTGRHHAEGKPLAEILLLRDEATRRPVEIPLHSAPRAGAVTRRPLLLLAPAGERLIDVTVRPFHSEPEAWDGTVLVLHDVTEQRLQEKLRRRTERLASADRRKDQFLAMLAQELRNPLAPIRNAVELMRQVEIQDPTFQPSRELVERQVKHLARLVDDLLDVSRLGHGSIRLRREAVDLGAVLERAVEAVQPLIASRNHTLTVELPRPSLRLEADAARLEQVVTNLLDNAARYTLPGGRILLSGERAGKDAVVRVRDTGIGVPPDVLDRVFEPFVQADGQLAQAEGGLGVGLTLVRSLIEMQGGSVEAHSPGLGQGSEFVVRLPIQEPKGALLAAAEPAAATSHRLRVLAVESDAESAGSLAFLLRLWQHEVTVVPDARDILDTARAVQPEVVLLDFDLPGGLDGYQVARKLRKEPGRERTVLIALTAHRHPEDRRHCQEAGIQHLFAKPVEAMALRKLLTGLAHPAGREERHLEICFDGEDDATC